MRIALGLLAAALAGAEGPPAPPQEATPLVFQFHVLEMAGLDWRESTYFQLRREAQQGTGAVWTTSREVAQALIRQADRVRMAPKLATIPGRTASFAVGSERAYVAHLTRPVDDASTVASQPEIGMIQGGIQVTVCGIVVEQGLWTRVDCEDNRILSVHDVKVARCAGVPAKPGPCNSATVQVPEVISKHVRGEWLIPDDGVLVVSLGAQTVVDDEGGSASVRERLVIVEPDLPAGTARAAVTMRAVYVPMAPPMLAPLPYLVIEGARVRPAPALPPPADSGVGRAMPPTPARSLPPAFDPDGSPATLPPLPDEEVKPVASDASAEPRPSPQTRNIPASQKSEDDSAAPESLPVDRKSGGVTSASRNVGAGRKDSDADVVPAGLVDRPQPACCCAADACPAETKAEPDSVTIRIRRRGRPTIEVRASRPSK